MTHPSEDIDNDHNDGISRPGSGISAGAITSISHTAIEYSQRALSSRSVRFSSETYDHNSLPRPQSGESTHFSCANSESTLLTVKSKPSDKKMLRRCSKDSEISFANSGSTKSGALSIEKLKHEN